MAIARPLLLAAVACLALGGCANPGPAGPDPTNSGPPAVRGLPADLFANDTMPPSVDLVSSGGPTCQPPATACFHYPFHATSNVTATAKLSWPSPANDLDLYLMQGGRVVDSSRAPTTDSESTQTTLPPGDYEFVVQGSTSAGTAFRFEARFTAAPPA